MILCHDNVLGALVSLTAQSQEGGSLLLIYCGYTLLEEMVYQCIHAVLTSNAQCG